MDRRRTRTQQHKRHRKRDPERTAETVAAPADRFTEVIEDTRRVIEACEESAPAAV